MSCARCSLQLENGCVTATTPCCAASYHTVCFMTATIDRNYAADSIRCPGCNLELVSAPHPAEEDDGLFANGAERVRQRAQNNPAFATALATFKSKTRGLTKPITAVSKALQAAQREFRETVAPHLAAIRAARQNTLEALKESPVYKEGKAAERRATAARTTLSSKFPDLSWGERHHLFRPLRRVRMGYESYRFRVRV